MEMKIAAVRRDEIFSPNHVESDELILKRTGDHLKKLGCEILYYNECDIHKNPPQEPVIFSMARSESAIDALKALEVKGAIVFNSPESIRLCYRENVLNTLARINAPIPQTVFIDTNNPDQDLLKSIQAKKQWIKTNKHTIHKEDITLTYNFEERLEILKEYFRRGIDKVIVQEYIEGDEIKFYSVSPENYFYWMYRNGDKYKFLEPTLIKYAEEAAKNLQLSFYGGDAIIDKNGNIFIIDINDWPSFGPVREEAACKIANVIFRAANEKYTFKPTHNYVHNYQ